MLTMKREQKIYNWAENIEGEVYKDIIYTLVYKMDPTEQAIGQNCLALDWTRWCLMRSRIEQNFLEDQINLILLFSYI